jgi:hypothetical protein
MRKEIIEVKDLKSLEGVYASFSDLLSKRMYPFTKGVPFCCAKIEHCIELFVGTGKGEKPDGCSGCVLKKFCDHSKDSDSNFVVKAVKKCDKDLLLFLEERDERINDWI